MITLITGASHCGKTYLAQKLLEKDNTPYLSIDHLKMGLIRSGNTDLTPEDHLSEIKIHASDIEVRLDDACLTIEDLKRDNHLFIDGFCKAGEKVNLIDDEFESFLTSLCKDL